MDDPYLFTSPAENGCTSKTKTVYIILAFYARIMLNSYMDLLCCLFFPHNFLMPSGLCLLLLCLGAPVAQWVRVLNYSFPAARVGGGGVKQLVLSVRPFVCLSVRPSVRLSVRCLSTQKSGYLAIYRVKRLLNTTVTLKSKKNVRVCT